MASSALGFENGLTGVNQVLVQKHGGEEPKLRLREMGRWCLDLAKLDRREPQNKEHNRWRTF